MENKSPTVLAVDDDEKVALFIQTILRKEGYECAVSLSADDAAARLRKQTYDILIVDYHMPSGMTGVDLLRLVRLQSPMTRRILISGSQGETLDTESLQAEGLVNQYFSKPILPKSLLEGIDRLTHGIKENREAFLVNILKSTPDPTIVANREGKILWFNSRFQDEFDWEPTELIGKSVECILPERLHHEHIALRNRYFDHPKVITMAADRSGVVLNGKGEEIRVELNLSYNEADSDMVIVTARNVERRLEMEDELIQYKERLSQAQTMARLGHWDYVFAKETLIWSDQTYAIFERDPSEGISLDLFFSYIHPEDLLKVQEAYSDHVELKKDYQIMHRIVLGSKEVRYVYEKCITERDEDDLPIRSIGTIQDITEQFQGELKNQTIFDNAPVGIATVDEEGVILEINPHFCDLFGDAPHRLSGKNFAMLIHPEDINTSLKELRDHFLTGNPKMIENRCIKKDNSSFWARTRLVCLGAGGFDSSRSMLLIRDITSEKAEKEAMEKNALILEEKVKERTRELEESRLSAVKANQAKTHFLANMSHEIRTPLNAIIGFSRLIRESGNEDEQSTSEYLRHIDTAGSLLSEVIGNVLDLSKIEEGKMKVELTNLSLHALIKGIFHVNKSLAMAKELDYSFCIHPDAMEWVKSDRTLLNQIAMNLVSNAIKFTDKGKKVTLRLDSEGDQTQIVVEDEGIGMDKEQLSRVFKPFEQADNSTRRQFGGTGLGLAITRKMCELLGGSLEVTSELGKGSSFVASLPLERGERRTERSVERKFRSELSGVVVDDNPVNLILMKSVMKNLGIHIQTCASGEEFLKLLKLDLPDFVILDLHMPDMDGKEVLSRIPKSLLSTTFMFSADVLEESRQACLKLGVDIFLSKPLNKDELVQVLWDKFGEKVSGEGL